MVEQMQKCGPLRFGNLSTSLDANDNTTELELFTATGYLTVSQASVSIPDLWNLPLIPILTWMICFS
jgi:hypothetical protein